MIPRGELYVGAKVRYRGVAAIVCQIHDAFECVDLRYLTGSLAGERATAAQAELDPHEDEGRRRGAA